MKPKIFFLISIVCIQLSFFNVYAQEENTPKISPSDQAEVEAILTKAQQPGFNPTALTEEEQQKLQSILRPSLYNDIASVPSTAESVNCFDYYKFGSVQVDIGSDIASTVSGAEMLFKGTIINVNNYPIVDGAVYVKIFRKDADIEAEVNGFHVVDQFFAQENVTLAAQEKKDIDFMWNVPAYAISGDYQIATFFVSAKKFNLLGLSFTDDVVGNIFDFNISGENQEVVKFDKNSVKINEQKFQFAAFPPRVSTDQKTVTISVNITNNTPASETVPVEWKLYKWDALTTDNLIDQKKENILLSGGETKNISFDVTDEQSSVYYLVAQTAYRDVKSIADIRFVREDVDGVRINFPSIIDFPLKKDTTTSIFSCVHGSGTSAVVNDNKLVLTLLDDKGEEIHTYTYDGAITGDMMGLKSDFVPEKNYDKVTLKAELFYKGTKVDSATITYDCNQINKSLCSTQGDKNSTTQIFEDEQKTYWMIAIVSIVCMIVLGGVLYFAIKKTK